MSERRDFEVIAALVPPGSRVLDLGCGDGALLALLREQRGCTGYGIELDDAKVLGCVQRGVNVLQLNLDEGLAIFDDASFDVVLQLDTLQNLRNTETMLLETARVGRIGIVSFPNFAHWPNRLAVVRGPHAGDEGAAVPVVRHAQHPRRHLRRLRGARAKHRAAHPSKLRPAPRPRRAPAAEPAREHGGVQVRARMTAITTADGIELRLREWPARTPARGTVLLVHGLGEHLGRYERLARGSTHAAGARSGTTSAATA